MRLIRSPGLIRAVAALCAFVALPAGAATGASALDSAQLTAVWVPAAAYGFTLLAVLGKNQK